VICGERGSASISVKLENPIVHKSLTDESHLMEMVPPPHYLPAEYENEQFSTGNKSVKAPLFV